MRKYDLLNTIDGKLALTILQKHSLTESVTSAGILTGYWENEVPQPRSAMKVVEKAGRTEYEPRVSPVYSLEVQSECMFLLSGLDSGGIAMQSIRFNEGSTVHHFKDHSSVVNLLRLNTTEDRFLSGSWDKRILEWDLNRPDAIVNEFKGNTSELSSLEPRPLFSSVDLTRAPEPTDTTTADVDMDADDDEVDSLFGDEDEEDSNAAEPKDTVPAAASPGATKTQATSHSPSEEISSDTLNIVYDESVFMTSGLNGSINIWDKRTPDAPVINLDRGDGMPPWCFSACWSASGDQIYAGRRNACIEEYDLKMPKAAANVLRLPTISGPVTCVKAMPNQRQLLVGSRDNVRLFDTHADQKNSVPFLIVPGHHGGAISNLYVDPSCRFLISTSGNRGWQGGSTDTVLIYEIDLE